MAVSVKASSFRRGFVEETADAYKFTPPPEAPVFKPTEEEFRDPLLYIAKIRSVGEAAGICKIIPPPEWQPPFAVDVDNFKFIPRVQRLKELEACTRVRLNFLDQLAKFWQLQGVTLKIPSMERKTLDLYHLYDLVTKNGGMDAVTRGKKWHRITIAMGYEVKKNTSQMLKNNYERILHPFEVIQRKKEEKEAVKSDLLKKRVYELVEKQEYSVEKKVKEEDVKMKLGDENTSPEKKTKVGALACDLQKEEVKEVKAEDDLGVEMEGADYTPHGIISRQAIKPPSGKYGRRSGACFSKPEYNGDVESMLLDDPHSLKNNRELQRLGFFGAGPKLPGYAPNMKHTEKKTRGKKVDYIDPMDKYMCKTCHKGDKEEQILLCDGCDDSYHMYCLVPPLVKVPDDEWRCPQCAAKEVCKATEAFGFEQAAREYTLQQFGEMADQFKEDYFRMAVHKVPTEVVEKEFWRIVSTIDEDVTVEYGADLHTMDHGSGFPVNISDEETLTCELEYTESPWNLNNLPLYDGSVLQYIKADISGMTVPWMYVGMCFATFCWHNEDHWNYSINYLHWGEPKTWYGVPGTRAEIFEATMKAAAPELFSSQPDLLHQLVTIMNPNLLMQKGVPVVRTDQQAGEFVVTFPRAYHAGFNQGYNFAEAVNFAPADWLKMGRECISHYANVRRFCVFSHDELVCKMAERPEELDRFVAAATYEDMVAMVRMEKKLRKSVLEWGVHEAEQHKFELLKDDERVCELCKTTIFLSGLTCRCSERTNKIACLKHYTELCPCAPEQHVLRYRFTLDQLLSILQLLKQRAEKG